MGVPQTPGLKKVTFTVLGKLVIFATFLHPLLSQEKMTLKVPVLSGILRRQGACLPDSSGQDLREGPDG